MHYLQTAYSNTRLLCIFFVFVICLSLFPSKVFAQAYGSGNYGGGNYNTGDSSSNSTGANNASGINSASAPSCGNTPPTNSPQWLYAATPQDGNSITLYFTDASGSYDHYVVRYGLSAGNYTFGLDNAGGNGTRTVTIHAFLPNTTYYFQVRAGNGCAPGPWSNEISTTTLSIVSTNNLAFTSTQVVPQQNTKQEETKQQAQNSCQMYTVRPGDTLYAVAKKFLGDGNKYPQLIDQNKKVYSSLMTSSDLEAGWKLEISCQNTATNKQQGIQQSASGYNVNVSVKDTNNKPVAGAEVTLHSTSQHAKTDKNGVATFHNIEQGQHQVIIAYANYQGQENINLTGNVKSFNVDVKVKPVNVTFSPEVLIIIGVLAGIIILLSILLLMKNKLL